MIALIDYGIGNLRSVQKALSTVGADVLLTDEPDKILTADKVVLPGVGAFGDGMAGLISRQLDGVLQVLNEQRKPLLGICLGMQLLFDSSEELGEHPGLGFLPGKVIRFKSNDLKIPHTGWNQIHTENLSPLLHGLEPGSYAYFNHSFYCSPELPTDVLASTEYGLKYASVVGRGHLYGVQFHPEKSQSVGLKMLHNFVEGC
ncbi:MAG: imidazole glycerol phosphate synthase subunit HisH [Anaerolineales bacterium]|nr:imidazole glycerol phosphate synthase subunit HisH [Anaerolineales bacterium]